MMGEGEGQGGEVRQKEGRRGREGEKGDWAGEGRGGGEGVQLIK